MAIPTEHQGIIPPISIRINYTTPPYSLYRKIQYALSNNLLQYLYPITLKYTKNWDFSSSTSASLTLPLSTKLCLIHLYLATEKTL